MIWVGVEMYKVHQKLMDDGPSTSRDCQSISIPLR